jgi:hypothetical protein
LERSLNTGIAPSKRIHVLQARIERSRVLIVSATVQMNIGLAVFLAPGPRRLVVKLQKVS